ncbi:MAG: hypothetical protein KGQ37_03710 [Hyphomicrobiales bacterium]|nr:hypothetical protein [Hyphomicrobiales bacterium]
MTDSNEITAASTGGMKIIRAKGLEPKSMVTSNAPTPGAAADMGRVMARRAPPVVPAAPPPAPPETTVAPAAPEGNDRTSVLPPSPFEFKV